MYRFSSAQVCAVVPLLLFGFACSSVKTAEKTVLSESGPRPSWVESSKSGWTEDRAHKLRAMQEIRGNERLSACFDLARLNARSGLVSEIQASIKGVLDTHEATLSENAEIILSKSRTEEFGGKISGLRFVEDYSMRYRIGEDERVSCHVLAEIAKDDYTRLKRLILTKVEEADPRLKEQIINKGIDFFKKD
jgi:hypothetical protein